MKRTLEERGGHEIEEKRAKAMELMIELKVDPTDAPFNEFISKEWHAEELLCRLYSHIDESASGCKYAQFMVCHRESKGHPCRNKYIIAAIDANPEHITHFDTMLLREGFPTIRREYVINATTKFLKVRSDAGAIHFDYEIAIEIAADKSLFIKAEGNGYIRQGVEISYPSVFHKSKFGKITPRSWGNSQKVGFLIGHIFKHQMFRTSDDLIPEYPSVKGITSPCHLSDNNSGVTSYSTITMNAPTHAIQPDGLDDRVIV